MPAIRSPFKLASNFLPATGGTHRPLTDAEPGGGGFGLAIVRSGVEAHEGTVGYRGGPGGGAVSRIVLPLAPAADSEIVQREAATALAERPRRR